MPPRWPIRILLTLVLVAIAGLTPEARHAGAATNRFWAGPTGGNWSTPGNWNPVGPPVNGDALVFTGTSQGKTTNNDLVELTVASLTLNAATKITGNRLGISATVAMTYAGIATLDLPLVLKGDVEMSVVAGARLSLREEVTPLGIVAVDVGGHRLTLSGGSNMEVNGDLIGGGQILANVANLDYLTPVTYAGTVSVGPATTLHLTVIGNGSGYCGSAPNTKFVLGGGTLQAACNASVAGISGAGTVELFDSGHLTITGQPGATFNGEFKGFSGGFVRCCGTGSETVKGVSALADPFFLESGRLAFDGASFGSGNFVVTGGTLAGYGFFGDTIANSSTIAFDPVNGHVGPANFFTLQLSSDVHARFSIHGPRPNVDYTQVAIGTQIVLDNAILDLDFGDYSPAAGAAITLVKNAGALLDTFKGLPEGATLSVGPLTFKITYKGGAGHDVIITSLGSSAPPAPSPSPAPGSRPFKAFMPYVAADL